MIYPIPFPKSPDYVLNDKFFSDDEIENIFKLSKDIEYKKGPVVEGSEKNVRECLVKNLPWNDNFSWLYDKIILDIINVNNSNFRFSINGIEGLQLIKYVKDSIGYLQHKDTMDVSPGIKRKISMSVQLSDSKQYSGGEMMVNARYVLSKDKGYAIIFKSDLMHQVLPISSGERYSLVAWVCGAYVE